LKALRELEPDMTLPRTAIILATAVALAAPAPCAAQEPVRDFSQLNTRLKPGDTIWVTDAQGREVKGRINSLAPDSLGVDAGGFRTFSAGEVSMIQLRQGDSLGNGALIGLAVGGVGTGLACLASTEGPDQNWCLLAALVYGGIGAGIGVGIDALIPGKKLVAYRAPRTPGSSQARLSIAPVITPRAKGVAVSFAF
jgi:hypothetical protein